MKLAILSLSLFVSTTSFASASHPIFKTLKSSLGGDIKYFSENGFFESKAEEAKVKKLYSELNNSLMFLDRIELSKTSPLFKKFFKTSILDFLSSNIKGFEWDNLLGTPNAPIAMATGPGKEPEINVGFNFLKPHFSLVERSSILIHEARHNQHIKYDHKVCPSDFPYSSSSGVPLANEAACEDIVDGSYGVQIVFLTNVSRYCTNCDEQTKKIASSLANEYLKRIISNSAKRTIIND